MAQDSSVCVSLSSKGLLNLVKENCVKIESSELEQQVKNVLLVYINLKKEILEIIKNNYVEFKQNSKTSYELIPLFEKSSSGFEPILKECEIFLEKNKSQQLDSNKLYNLQNNLNDEFLSLRLIHNYLSMDILLTEAKQHQNDLQFNEMTSKLKQVEKMYLEELLYDREIIKGIINQHHFIFSEFFLEFSELLNSCTLENTNNTNFLIINHLNQEALKQYFEIFDHFNELKFFFKNFSMLFLDFLFKPIVLKNCSLLIEKNTIKILFHNEYDKNERDLSSILEDLRSIFLFMNTYLQLDSLNLFIKIGEVLSLELLKFFNNSLKCFEESYAEEYQEKVMGFKEFLINIGFVSEDLMKRYDFNINTIKKEDFFQHNILMTAKEMILNNNNDLVEIERIFPKLNAEEESVQFFEPCFIQEYLKVSSNVVELINWLNSFLEDASYEREALFITFRKILELFILEGEKYTSGEERSPNNIAVYHNNCFYLIQRYLKFGVHFKKSSKTYPSFNFTDIILRIKAKAYNVLQNFNEYEQKEMFDILDSTNKLQSENLDKCSKRLIHLKKVWEPLLPVQTCSQTLGYLLNSLINKILNEFNETDKSTSEMKLWFPLIKKLNTIGLKLFKEEKSLISNVALWDKLAILVQIFSLPIRELEIKLLNKELCVSKLFQQKEWKELIYALYPASEVRKNIITFF